MRNIQISHLNIAFRVHIQLYVASRATIFILESGDRYQLPDSASCTDLFLGGSEVWSMIYDRSSYSHSVNGPKKVTAFREPEIPTATYFA